MGNLKILKILFALIGTHGFIQLKMRNKPIFTKNENFYLEYKSETKNANAFYEGIHTMVIKLINNKTMKFNFRKFFFLTGKSCLFYSPSASDLYKSEQMDLRSITQSNLTIFVHACSDLFLCSSPFLNFIFDFSRNDINFHCSIN